MKTKLPVVSLFILFLTLSSLSIVAAGNPRVVNEAFALRNVRLLHGAQMVYSAKFGNDEFAPSLEFLRQFDLIDAALSSGTKHFYTFTVTAQPSSTANRSNFTVSAVPTRYGKTGKISFYADILGEIHGADKNGEPATAGDPILSDCSTGSSEDNDRCAIYSMLVLRTAERRYFAPRGYYGAMSDLPIPNRLRFGYDRSFVYSIYTVHPAVGTPAYYRITSQPYPYPQGGRMSYYYDETVGLRGADKNGGLANAQDPPVVVY